MQSFRLWSVYFVRDITRSSHHCLLLGRYAVAAAAILLISSVSDQPARAQGLPSSCSELYNFYFGAPWYPRPGIPQVSVGFDLVYTAPNLVSSYARGTMIYYGRVLGRSSDNGNAEQFFDDRRYGSGAPFNQDSTDRLGVTLFASPLVVRLDLVSWGNGVRWITVQGCSGRNVLFGTFNDGGGAAVMSLSYPYGATR